MARCAAVTVLLLAAVLPALCSGWLLEGLVGSWVVPEVHSGQRKRTEPERTQPLQLPEEYDQEPAEDLPLRPHPATPPPTRVGMTSVDGEERATPTQRDIETTVQLYRLLKDRRRANRHALGNADTLRGSKPTCIQRFICEVHMLPEHELATAGDIEKNIANMLKRFQLEPPASRAYQYTYAAHMGRLMRDSTASGCHEMFSSCPFSREEMLLLMEALNSSKSALA
ncbi:uncharacterized protein LOC122372628 [Amphibalanus amphitrite]|uniref:uncharacterized protein LOC122372628 n=1 Tax=Amphibalanus amphitrite TaxID=1232801 RepID=UPI001C9276ED|nr:uncharacterized protein LOC122372628 [Amphibalanus amphitrite]